MTKGILVSVCLLAVALMGRAGASPAVEWPVSDGGNGHLYAVTPAGSSWSQAEAYAVSQGGHLVTIDSAEENSFLQSTFLLGGGVPEDFWIGLYSPAGDWTDPATWTWVSGAGSTYRNWRSGQPDLGSNDRYAAIDYLGTGDAHWDNYPDSGFRTPRGIIELSSDPTPIPVTVPEPVSLFLAGCGLITLLGMRKKLR